MQPKKIIWNVKIKGEPNWHGVVDMVDLGGGDKGNNYVLADGRQVHQTLIEDIDFEPNKKLEKGVMKKFPFNPKKDISKKDYQKIRQWAQVGVGQDRSDISPLTGNARQRMLHRLSGMTKVKKNDKGERLFLLHRGVGKRELESHASGSHTNYKGSGLSTNSWTPDHSTALKFSNDPSGERVVSAWIHEKDISNMPLMHWDISKRLKNEKEVIISHSIPHEIIQDKNKAFKLALPYSKYGNETQITTAGPDGYNVHEDAADINYKINQRSLQKGLKGDWQKEGYVLKHSTSNHPKDGKRISVSIYHPSQLDKYGLPIPGRGVAGFGTFLINKDKTLKPLFTHTGEEHKRKGIASSIYKFAEDTTGHKIIPSDKQSEDAKKLWSQPNRPFGKSIQLLKKSLDQMERIACVVVSKGDQVLMGLRKDDRKFTFPGGHIDAGEDPKHGAKRELLEEAGIHADDLSFLGEQMKVGQDGKIRKIYVFALLDNKPLVTNKFDPDGEFSKMFWVNVKNGLPKTVENNLHVPKPYNLALELLGL